MDERVALVAGPELDIAQYCREVEAHLTRVNDGHIIRIVGPAFELARGWALEGVPLSVVCEGIDRKAERHRAGRARRALRLEFCAADVRATYERWLRAVGLRRPVAEGPAGESDEPRDCEGPVRPSAGVGRHLDRAIDRLSRVTGRLDLPGAFRDEVGRVCEAVAAVRDALRTARGPARAAVLERLPALDAALVEAARQAAGSDGLTTLVARASGDLAVFRGRLTPASWDQSVHLAATRLLREHFGLPTLTDE